MLYTIIITFTFVCERACFNLCLSLLINIFPIKRRLYDCIIVMKAHIINFHSHYKIETVNLLTLNKCMQTKHLLNTKVTFTVNLLHSL